MDCGQNPQTIQDLLRSILRKDADDNVYVNIRWSEKDCDNEALIDCDNNHLSLDALLSLAITDDECDHSSLLIGTPEMAIFHMEIADEIAGLVLTAGDWIKFDFAGLAKNLYATDGFVWDEVNSRIIWNAAPGSYIMNSKGNILMSTNTATRLTMETRDLIGNTYSEDVVDLNVQNKLQTAIGLDVLHNFAGNYLEFWIQADVNATITIKRFTILIQGR